MDWWAWLLIGLVSLRLAGDVVSFVVLAVACCGAPYRACDPDDLGG